VLIEPGYLFSQHSLNTYVRCQRRFLLRYIEHQPWPMPEDEDPLDYQRHLARGRMFHQWLVRRHWGIEMSEIVEACEDSLLRQWWRAVETLFPWDALPDGMREAELPVVVSLGEYRLYARYDYLALDPQNKVAVIVDWKTLASVPSYQVLRERIQTRVYLYTLIAASHVLTGGKSLAPDQVKMLYWFANYPDDVIEIPYSEAAFQQDAHYLQSLVREIGRRPREAFAPTEDSRLCTHCQYRTLCHREVITSAEEDWLDEEIDFALDLQDIPELEY